MSNSKTRFLFVHLLPTLHLCACVVLGLMNIESGVEYIGRADLPFTILIAPLVFWSSHPIVWFAVLGTMWWYLLSRGAELLVNRVRART
jgi:hypothetical protein